MTERALLHLVDAEGTVVNAEILAATEAAFRWVSKENPTLDKALLANWAEAVAKFMQDRKNTIESPERYAYAALKGKVRDWLRLLSTQEESSGSHQDMERIAGLSRSFQEKADRKILFDQLHNVLSERDRAILLLILNEKTSQDVADELNTSNSAARKAIQRVRDRSAAFLTRSSNKKDGAVDRRGSVDQRGLTVE